MVRKRRANFVDVVEAAYDFGGSDDAWLARIAEAAEPLLGRGGGVGAQLYYPWSVAPLSRGAFVAPAPGVLELFERLNADATPELGELFETRHTGWLSVLDFFTPRPHLLEAWRQSTRGSGFADILAVTCRAGDRTVVLVAPSRRPVAPLHHKTALAWRRVAFHVAAARRLRVKLGDEDALARGDAILDPSGDVRHATGGALAKDARGALRESVVRREIARSRRGGADGDALSLWRGLVDGRWSLIDHFDTDGKRFLVAIENAPELESRRLRPRERAAVRLAIEGQDAKDIAYSLGISGSNARALLAGGLKKLGIRRRAELYRFDLDAATVHLLDERGPRVLAAAVPVRRPVEAPASLEPLTSAEDEVRRLAEAGASNTEIARRRATSVRTVANQMAAILRKLGVRSRAELSRAPAR